MKKSILVTLLVFALSFGLYAEGEKKCKGKPNKAEMLKKFDADGNGTLSESERATAKEAHKAKHAERKAEMLTKFDVDGDGELNDVERETMKAECAANGKCAKGKKGRGGPKGVKDAE